MATDAFARARFGLPATLLLLGIGAFAPAAQPDPIDAALAKVGLTRQTCRIDRDNMNIYGGDQYRLQIYDLFMDDPFKMPDYVPVLCRSALQNSGSIGLSVTFAALRVKAGVRRGLIEDPVTMYARALNGPKPLAQAVAGLYGEQLSTRDLAAMTEKCSVLPESLNRALALITTVSGAAVRWRNLAFAALSPTELDRLYAKTVEYLVGLDADTTNAETVRFVESAIGKVDYEYLYLGATDLGLVLDSVVARLTAMTLPDSLRFRCATPLGDIVVNGKGNDFYDFAKATVIRGAPSLPFLILDLGGNDRYGVVAANQNVSNPISIVIDLAGDDEYRSEDKHRPAFGAGLLGYGFLVDTKGNDKYSGNNLTQGAGAFGVGVLYDGAGEDLYDAFTCAQGSGSFGLGVLIDRSGNDTYQAYQQVQGYGYTRGCGLLIDSSGNDNYIANDSNIVFPSAQSKEHNSSLAQGMGFGKRADYSDGHSLAGGVGMLIDGSGDDRYSCGIFGQGCSYWYGVGILADLEGNDNYHGIWYVQGAGAHFGVSMLYDASGNDHYQATMNMAQGAGHDFTLGWLLDAAGDDVYDAPNLSLGGGNANGMGIFWDQGGSDVFNPNSSAVLTLGRSSTDSPRNVGLRDYMLCLGMFLHTNSKGSAYPKERAFARPGTIWAQAGPNEKEPLAVEKGVGLDW